MKRCVRCILPETYPEISFDENGVCGFCNNAKEKEPEYRIFESEEKLKEKLHATLGKGNGYDILVPLSGGVDSSVALINIVEKMGLKALGFHFDHGFEDSIATENVERLCSSLNTDLIIKKHNNDFYLKLWKYVNASNIEGLSACYVCGNLLYLEAIETACRHEIPVIVNGYSKGQASLLKGKDVQISRFEEFFNVIVKDGSFFKEFMDRQKWLSRQKILESENDLETIPEGKILIVPFFQFQFYKTDKDSLKKICIDRFSWKPIKTTYPERTTNCEMIWLNVHCDRKKMGYSVYDEEYSTLIRAGEMTREKALQDLAFNPPEGLLEKLASEIGLKL